MIVKPTPAPADPSKVCKTCGNYDPDVQVCCADDCLISEEQSKLWHCGSWEPKKICKTCGHFNPDTNECWWFGEPAMSEEESLTRTCKSWEPRKEKLNVFSASETIGMSPVNPTQEERKEPENHKELEVKASIWSKQQEAVAIDFGVQQGMTLEMLDTVFDIACQQVPACAERWMKLKDKLHFMLCRKWVDEEIPE